MKYTGICYRKQIVSTNAKPTLKVRLPEFYDCVQLFELLFTKEYLRGVILKNINENIVGTRVTYGELLRWIDLWFIMATVIGPPQDSFFPNKPVDAFSDVPFIIVHYMSKNRFNKTLSAIIYNNSKAPPY